LAGGESRLLGHSKFDTTALYVRAATKPFAYIADVMQKNAQGWPNSRIDELMPWAAAPIAQEKAA
jgi:hypothetical protein